MTTLIADPEVAVVPVVETGDPLVELGDYGIACVNTGRGRLVRAAVAERLSLAQAALPGGRQLLVIEGFRSSPDQQRIFDAYLAELERTHPQCDESELYRLATRYVAPLEVAPHVAGAAVDLTLTDASGDPLWMGTEVDATPEQSGNACMFDAPGIDEDSRANRMPLAAALGAAGLVNYPTEWCSQSSSCVQE